MQCILYHTAPEIARGCTAEWQKSVRQFPRVLQCHLLEGIGLLQNCAGRRQRAHAVAVGVGQFQPSGRPHALDPGILFQAHHIDAGRVPRCFFRDQGAADQQQPQGGRAGVDEDGQLLFPASSASSL